MSFQDKLLEGEAYIVSQLNRISFLQNYTYHKVSARITIILIILGIIAVINELYISIDMFILSKKTYKQIRETKLEHLINHEMLNNDKKYFGSLEKNSDGQVVENFEEMKDFFAKPVHVAHLYIACAVLNKADKYKNIIDQPLRFHFEFSPEEFESSKYRPEYGCSLLFLKTKIYHFFKDSETFTDLKNQGYNMDNFKISKNIFVYNPLDEALNSNKLDDMPLCFLKIETGDRLKCELII